MRRWFSRWFGARDYERILFTDELRDSRIGHAFYRLCARLMNCPLTRKQLYIEVGQEGCVAKYALMMGAHNYAALDPQFMKNNRSAQYPQLKSANMGGWRHALFEG